MRDPAEVPAHAATLLRRRALGVFLAELREPLGPQRELLGLLGVPPPELLELLPQLPHDEAQQGLGLRARAHCLEARHDRLLGPFLVPYEDMPQPRALGLVRGFGLVPRLSLLLWRPLGLLAGGAASSAALLLVLAGALAARAAGQQPDLHGRALRARQPLERRGRDLAAGRARLRREAHGRINELLGLECLYHGLRGEQQAEVPLCPPELERLDLRYAAENRAGVLAHLLPERVAERPAHWRHASRTTDASL
mmetsp:Transcript_4499/g.13215  ORF Transcript_4499/g.13215 Transcript_4499/m.13215 type:complete len:253 (+) Transcript_4499:702-1460(+)